MVSNYSESVAESFIGRPFAVNVVCGLLMSITSAVAIGGNIATIIVVITNEHLRDEISNIYVVSLAITDLTTSVCVVIPSVVSIFAEDWIFGKLMCDFHQMMSYATLIMTTLLLAAISFDRAYAIRRALHYPSHITRKRVLILIAVITVDSVAISTVPAIMGWVYYDYWEVNCGLDWVRHRDADPYCYYCYTRYFIVPELIILISTALIFISARKSNKNLQVLTTQDGENKSKNDQKLFKSLFVLVLAFHLTFAPWTTIRFSKSITRKTVEPLWINTACTVMLFTGSAVNPFIYAIFRKDFQIAFKRLFRSIRNRIVPL